MLEVVGVKDKTAVVLDTSTAYAEMGGQVGRHGRTAPGGGQLWRVVNTQKSGNTWLHFLAENGCAGGRAARSSFAVDRRASRCDPAASYGDASVALGVA